MSQRECKQLKIVYKVPFFIYQQKFTDIYQYICEHMTSYISHHTFDMTLVFVPDNIVLINRDRSSV